MKKNKETKSIPVIMVSASPLIEALSKEAGADGFLEKPFKKKEILDLVSSYVSPKSVG